MGRRDKMRRKHVRMERERNGVWCRMYCSRLKWEETKDNIFTSDTDTAKGETHSNIRGRNDNSKKQKSGEQSSQTQA